MATVTYDYQNSVSSFFVNNTFTAGDQNSSAIARLANGTYFNAWTFNAGNTSVQGRIIGADGAPVNSEFLVNSTTTNLQFDPAVAGLTNGNAVVTFTDTSVDAGGDIRARLFDSTGTAIGPDFLVVSGTTDSRASDVTQLADGGFVVTWTHDFGAGDGDIRMNVYNADGTLRAGDTAGTDAGIEVSSTSAVINSDFSQVVSLANGEFIVVWQESPAGGGDTEVFFRRYAADGTPLDTQQNIDTTGSINQDIQVVGLADGGFVVAYTDNGWGISGTEITARVYNADGTLRQDYILVNQGDTGGAQNQPTLTALSNGFFTIGWSDGANLSYQTFDANGGRIGGIHTSVGSVIEGEIAALSGGLIANVRSSTIADASGDDSIRSSVDELVRTTVSDDTGEVLVGDNLRDIMIGAGGNDTLNGGENADNMSGGLGDDTYVVDNAADVVTEVLNEGVDTVVSSIDYALGADVENLVLTGAAVNGTGNDLNNTIVGNDLANALSGGAGNDTLDGGLGGDSMSGGLGDDTYMVDNVGDTVTEAAGEGTDTVQSSISFTLAADFENLTLTGSGAIDGTGNALNNVMTGNEGANKLFGGLGNDTMSGGGGNDLLSGGLGVDILNGNAGADVFDFDTKLDSRKGALRDTVFFSHAEGDMIDLSTMDAATGRGNRGNQDFEWVNENKLGAKFTGEAGELRFKKGVLSGDINGDGKADFEIKIVGKLMADDLIF